MSRKLTEGEVERVADGLIGATCRAEVGAFMVYRAPIDGLTKFANAILSKYGGGISEQDARARERAAWDAALTYALSTPSCAFVQCSAYLRERDRRYPALPPAPAASVLSDQEIIAIWKKADDWSGYLRPARAVERAVLAKLDGRTP